MAMDLISKILRSIRSIDESRIESFLNDYMDYLDNMDKYISRDGAAVYLDDGDALVFGDIHGDIATLSLLLDKANAPKLIEGGGKLIFLGDYIDRGEYQIETILFLITLQLMYKDRVILLRGNHEPPQWLLPYPHDFPIYLRSRYPSRWREIYKMFLDIFDKLPLLCLTKSGVVMLHGGISVKHKDINSYKTPDRSLITEILWNDPMAEDGYRPSYRGAGYLFGPDITTEFLRQNDLRLIIRGHEPTNGYEYRHSGRIITLFSRTGPPYMNRRASALRISLYKPYSPGDEQIISISEDEIRDILGPKSPE